MQKCILVALTAHPLHTTALAANLTHPKYKNKLLVIVADYPHNVDRLFRVNAGMRSRFTERIEFALSSPQDCVALVKRTVECAPREELPPGAEELLLEVFADLAARDGWANSRDVLGEGGCTGSC